MIHFYLQNEQETAISQEQEVCCAPNLNIDLVWQVLFNTSVRLLRTIVKFGNPSYLPTPLGNKL